MCFKYTPTHFTATVPRPVRQVISRFVTRTMLNIPSFDEKSLSVSSRHTPSSLPRLPTRIRRPCHKVDEVTFFRPPCHDAITPITFRTQSCPNTRLTTWTWVCRSRNWMPIFASETDHFSAACRNQPSCKNCQVTKEHMFVPSIVFFSLPSLF